MQPPAIALEPIGPEPVMEELIRQCLPTYEVVGKIGEGVYGSIHKVRDRFKERAVKIVPLQAERSPSLPEGRDLHSRISRDFHAVREYYEVVKGQGVLEIYDFYLLEDEADPEALRANLLILMEYCPENLNRFVSDRFPLDASTACRLMRDLALALHRLSRIEEGVFIVTDLKPANLLIDGKGRLVIGDPGGFKRIRSLSTVTGAQYSPSWCAPEIVLQGAAPDVPAMIYAYGLVAYFLWEGCLPYEDLDFSERFDRIRSGGLSFRRSSVPDGIRALVERCLAFDPADRFPDFTPILERLDPAADSVASSGPAAGRRSRESAAPARIDPDATRAATEGPLPDASGPEPGAQWKEPFTQMLFVWVPGGRFRMGALEGDEEADADESPRRDIAVHGFWMARTPLTQRQWAAVMGGNPSHFQRTDNQPVEQVRFAEAVAFARRLSERHDNRFRFGLPSEEQWEYAARSAGRPERFPGGRPVDAVAWYSGNSGLSTQPVATRAPNGLGLFDMGGNVQEWCVDVYRPHLRAAACSDSIGTDSGMLRVCRGGSWRLPARRCRTTARKGVPQGLRYTDLGVRIVREA